MCEEDKSMSYQQFKNRLSIDQLIKVNKYLCLRKNKAQVETRRNALKLILQKAIRRFHKDKADFLE